MSQSSHPASPGSIRIISPKELAIILQDVNLIDVRLAADFDAAHVTGAANNCVFEVAFTERLASLAPDKSRPIAVYGNDPESHESRVAAEKLLRIGYSSVIDLREGLSAWIAAGLPTEPHEAVAPMHEVPLPSNGRHEIDLSESRIEWLGRNLLNKHAGVLPLKSGYLQIENGALVAAECQADLASMRCTDLADTPAHHVLIAHLLSDDFFDAGRYPEVRFVLSEAALIPGATPGLPNLSLRGNLTLRGVQVPVELQACAGVTPEGKLAAQASFSIDRTLWGSIYGSSRFFRNLGGHLVNDLIDLQLRIVTQ